MIHLPRMPRVQACVFQLFAGTFGDIQKTASRQVISIFGVYLEKSSRGNNNF